MNKKFVLILILLTLFSALLFYLFSKSFIKKSTNDFDNDLNESSNKASSLFRINKIILFSSADAISNISNQALWDLNIYQYTNIGLYFDIDAPIKRIYLSNFAPLKLYYKMPDDFGNGKFSEQDSLASFISFESPITLININRDLAKNYIVANTSELLFDGSLLKRAGIKLENIDKEISFDINIITENDEHFVCKFSLDVMLEKSENESIYNGYIIDTIENPNYQFFKEE